MKNNLIENISQSNMIKEFKRLEILLCNDKQIIELTNRKSKLHSLLNQVDKYSTEYENYKTEYNEVSKSLLDNQDYVRYKALERELNLFIMYCNKELKKLFDLNSKGCSK